MGKVFYEAALITKQNTPLDSKITLFSFHAEAVRDLSNNNKKCITRLMTAASLIIMKFWKTLNIDLLEAWLSQLRDLLLMDKLTSHMRAREGGKYRHNKIQDFIFNLVQIYYVRNAEMTWLLTTCNVW